MSTRVAAGDGVSNPNTPIEGISIREPPGRLSACRASALAAGKVAGNRLGVFNGLQEARHVGRSTYSSHQSRSRAPQFRTCSRSQAALRGTSPLVRFGSSWTATIPAPWQPAPGSARYPAARLLNLTQDKGLLPARSRNVAGRRPLGSLQEA